MDFCEGVHVKRRIGLLMLCPQKNKIPFPELIFAFSFWKLQVLNLEFTQNIKEESFFSFRESSSTNFQAEVNTFLSTPVFLGFIHVIICIEKVSMSDGDHLIFSALGLLVPPLLDVDLQELWYSSAYLWIGNPNLVILSPQIPTIYGFLTAVWDFLCNWFSEFLRLNKPRRNLGITHHD